MIFRWLFLLIFFLVFLLQRLNAIHPDYYQEQSKLIDTNTNDLIDEHSAMNFNSNENNYLIKRNKYPNFYLSPLWLSRRTRSNRLFGKPLWISRTGRR